MKGQNESLQNWKLTDFIIFCLIKFNFDSNVLHTLGHINEAAWFCALFSLSVLISLLKTDANFQGNSSFLGSKMQNW